MFRDRMQIALLLLAGAMVLAGVVSVTADPTSQEDTIEQRRARIEAMSPQEKELLRQKQERFVSLTEEERQKLRAFHEELNQAEDRQQLRGTLERYYSWLATLPPGERSDLLKMPPAERVERIKTLVRQQEEKRFRDAVREQLTEEDRRAIFAWLDQFLKEHEEEIFASVPEELRQRAARDPRSRWPMMFMVVRKWNNADPDVPQPTPSEVQDLMSRLSERGRQALQRESDPKKRVQLTQKWIAAAIESRQMPAVSQRELRKFYAEQLTAEQRDRLDSMTPEKMQAELTRLFHEHRWRRYWQERGGPPRDERDNRGGGPDRRGPRGRGERFEGRRDDRPGPPEPDRDGRPDDKRGDDEVRPERESDE